MTRTIDLSKALLTFSLLCVSACEGVIPAGCGVATGGDDGNADDDGGGGDDDGGGPVEHEQPCPKPERETPPLAELCPPQRQIVEVAGDCPTAEGGSGWTTETLFASQTVPAAMQHYCRYTWTGAGDPTPATLPAAVQGQTSPDCRVVPQSPMAAGLSGPFAQAFSQGVQPIPNAEAALGPGVPVDIAVVDTAPPQTNDGQAAHGPTIAALVAAAASGCVPGLDKQACRRQVSTHLGLPQTRAGADRARGGYYGYQSDLAEGIVAAVDGWTNRDHKLIVTLAVGWEPGPGDLDPTGNAPTAAIAAVRDAIALAHCQGALVIAASGNQPRGSCVDQPTGPGSWERQPGWHHKQCVGLGLPGSAIELGAPAQLHPYHPLVHAATPVDWSLANLGDHRPGSDARIAALGFAGFTELAGQAHGPLTGSSISTAAVSGIAAVLWSYFPSLSADEVMQAIYAGGTARTVDNAAVRASLFLRGQQAPEQHVVTACGALAWACGNVTGPGPKPSAAQCQAAASNCGAYSSPGVDVAAWWTSFDQTNGQLASAARVTGAAPTWAEYECPRCGEATVSRLPTTTPIPAGAMGDPWVLPQPEIPPCPMCILDDDEIYLSLDDEYANMTLDNVTVELTDATGGAEHLSYGQLPLSATTVYVVTDAALQRIDRTGQPPATARVTMVFTDSSDPSGPTTITASNEIPVR